MPNPATSRLKLEDRCVHPTLKVKPSSGLSLPVLADHSPAGKIRASKNGPRRAVVLAAVQLLIIGHILLWAYGAFGGKTITPVEPSESMEFVKHGVVNAGLIFFAVALLSTLILGRWFCGWGCHIVMLQDLCGWFMKKCGVRPKPFRSRLLIYVPLLLALYMFVWPAVYRWGLAPVTEQLAAMGWEWVPNLGPVPEWGLKAELTTTEFWKTFPGAMVAIPFLLICGFATVYFLGAKGFCTYGCPYGGFFAPLDKLAPARIRVTDACEGCGHCTAVCTSNVRVHEEVREYGMVVDPGCMKCMDCVSVCPNEALYFGFGKPAAIKGPAKNEPPKRKYDLSVREEIGMAIIFALLFFAFRGEYARFPLLMAAGVAGVMTFIIWKALRMAFDQNVNLYKFQLRLRGSVKPAGWVFAALAASIVGLSVHSGFVNAATAAAGWHDDKVQVPRELVYWSEGFVAPAQINASAGKALRMYRAAASIAGDGLGLAQNWRSNIDIRVAWLHSVRGELDEAERILRRGIESRGRSESLCSALAMVLAGQHKDQDAMDFYTAVLRDPEGVGYLRMLDEFALWAINGGAAANVVHLCQQRLQRDANDVAALRVMTIALAAAGGADAADQIIALCRRWIELEPNSAEPHRMHALALAEAGRMEEAVKAMETALKIAPQRADLNSLMNQFRQALGQK